MPQLGVPQDQINLRFHETVRPNVLVMRLNARAPFFLIQEAVPLLRSAPRGLIVNTAIVSDVRPDMDTSELISPDDVAETVQFLLSMKGNAVIDELVVRRATKAAWSV